MNLSILKKTIPAVLLATVCASALSAGAMTASAAETDNNTDTMPTGALEMTEEEETALREFFGEPDTGKRAVRGAVGGSAVLPASVDLSEQPNFPAIGSQDNIPSCGAWATTYYQFNYEAYKGTDVDLKNPANHDLLYAPRFTYNFCNGGRTVGTYLSDYFIVLKNQGCLKEADYPYLKPGTTYATPSNFDLKWSTDEDKLREALGRRITDKGSVYVPSSTSSGMTKAKEILYGTDGTDGHVLTLGTYYYRWKTKKWHNPATNKDEDVAWGCYGYWDAEKEYYVYDGNHFMTIVGYNDNVWVDINGNGVDEPEEYGAFKVANSHGDDQNNEGFWWVSYDALNAVSKVPDAPHEGDYADRQEIFWNGYLYWFSVGDVDNYYVGEAEVNTTNRDVLSVTAVRSSANAPTSYARGAQIRNQISNSHDFAFNGPVVFAYDDLSDPIESYLTGYNFGVDIRGTGIESASFRILDSKGNVVNDFGAVTTEPTVKPMNLKMGDLNYDNVLNADDNTIYEAADFSDLQEVLARNYSYEDHEDHHNNDDELIPNGKIRTEYIVNGDSVTVNVYNEGEADLRNWALRVDNFGGTPHDFWNATLDGDVIYCVDFNSVIPVGGYVTFGYKLSDMTGAVPTFTLCSAVIDVTDLVDVLFECVGDYGNSAQYKITLINNDSEDIIGWSISFTAEGFVINNVWGAGNGFELNDGVYTINCANYNGCNVIPADGQVEIFFMATKDGDGAISDIHVYAITEIESVND